MPNGILFLQFSPCFFHAYFTEYKVFFYSFIVKSPWISFFQSLATGSSFQRVVYAGDNISRFICLSGAMPRPANHTFPRPEWLMLSTTFNGWLLLLRGAVTYVAAVSCAGGAAEYVNNGGNPMQYAKSVILNVEEIDCQTAIIRMHRWWCARKTRQYEFAGILLCRNRRSILYAGFVSQFRMRGRRVRP